MEQISIKIMQKQLKPDYYFIEYSSDTEIQNTIRLDSDSEVEDFLSRNRIYIKSYTIYEAYSTSTHPISQF